MGMDPFHHSRGEFHHNKGGLTPLFYITTE